MSQQSLHEIISDATQIYNESKIKDIERYMRTNIYRRETMDGREKSELAAAARAALDYARREWDFDEPFVTALRSL